MKRKKGEGETNAYNIASIKIMELVYVRKQEKRNRNVVERGIKNYTYYSCLCNLVKGCIKVNEQEEVVRESKGAKYTPAKFNF